MRSPEIDTYQTLFRFYRCYPDSNYNTVRENHKPAEAKAIATNDMLDVRTFVSLDAAEVRRSVREGTYKDVFLSSHY